jgi:PilS N terminal
MNAYARSPHHPGQSQRGNSLIYMLLALVLGGIGLAVGVQQYQDAERSTMVQLTVAEVNVIIGNAKQQFGRYGFDGLTTEIAVGSQVIPQSMAGGNFGAMNRFGGWVSLSRNVPVPGTAQLLYVGVPVDVCVGIVTGTQAQARAVQVNTQQAKPLDGVLDLAVLASACSAGGGSQVPIMWTLGRN